MAKKKARSAARFFATQALFQMEASDTPLEDVQEQFETYRIGAELDGDIYAEADIEHFRTLIREAVSLQARIDQMTDTALVEKWPIARIDPTLRAVFRAAGAELLAMDTPPKVIITEFVDVTRAFFPEGKESKLVNAVLDHVARAAKPDAFK